MIQSKFARFSFGVLIYNLAVVVWGAFVAASLSGAGCGAHWPLCDGQVLPVFKDAKRVIEFVHRTSSGIVLILVAVLCIWAFRAFSKGHPVRKAAFFSLVFTLTEAALGAMLVLFEWVALNPTEQRAFAHSLHLVNTFLLIGALTLTFMWARGAKRLDLKGQGVVPWALGFGLLGVLVLGVSGSVTALGDRLYPVSNLMEGFKQDLSPTSSFLIHLRLLHPLIATSVGLYLVLIIGLVNYLRPSDALLRAGRWIGGLFVLQMGLGFLDIWLMAPIWLQLVHLAVADLLWIAMIVAVVTALGEGVKKVEMGKAHVPDPEDLAAKPQGMALVKDYLILTKPRVISLLLFTTLTAMFVAAGGWPGGWLFLAVAVGGYMAAGGANTINMVIERDLDAKMKRTSKRPIVTRHISTTEGLIFGLALAAGSFGLLWWAANLLAAVMALSGLVFYVFVYTMLLKRRTWHNIVIGGAAGAFPPLVGWAAVTGELSPLAWWLFLIVFTWTPVHFWALALLIKDDYAKAEVPMLPVVLGEKVTVIQIGLYSIATALISSMPLLQRQVGPMYLVGAVALNALLILRSLQLYQRPDRPHAVTLYKYSMVYLALLFLVMAFDRSFPM
jgi:protoheme IX farnesyltransferase